MAVAKREHLASFQTSEAFPASKQEPLNSSANMIVTLICICISLVRERERGLRGVGEWN